MSVVLAWVGLTYSTYRRHVWGCFGSPVSLYGEPLDSIIMHRHVMHISIYTCMHVFMSMVSLMVVAKTKCEFLAAYLPERGLILTVMVVV